MSITILHKSKNNCNFCQNKFSQNVTNNQKKRQTMVFNNPAKIIGKMSIVGQKEGKGPMGSYFDTVLGDDKMGEKCFESAEINMLSNAVLGAIKNASLKTTDVDLLISGDLLNQITSSSYVARNLGIPYMGVYSACSTMTACLSMGAALVCSGHYNTVACSTASHFATAERQFRYPLEYGCNLSGLAAECGYYTAGRLDDPSVLRKRLCGIGANSAAGCLVYNFFLYRFRALSLDSRQ